MSDLIDKQAAIKAIEKLCEECNADYCGECRVKFDGVKNCKTILEQLPPVKPEYCEDAISRELAFEKMADYVASGYADSAEDFEEYSKIICQLPPVYPEPTAADIARQINEELSKPTKTCGLLMKKQMEGKE